MIPHMERTPNKPRPAMPDADLVRAAQAGDERALEDLFRRHLRMAYGLAYRLLGRQQELDDVVQESFTQALGSLRKLEDPSFFGTWLGRIVIHTVNRVRRREKLQTFWGLRSTSGMDIDGLLAPSAPPEARIELEQLYRRLAALPEKPRTVFIMRRIEGRPMEEVAVMAGVSLATAKRWFNKAAAAIGDGEDVVLGNVAVRGKS